MKCGTRIDTNPHECTRMHTNRSRIGFEFIREDSCGFVSIRVLIPQVKRTRAGFAKAHLSSRQIAGQRTARASGCASVVFPDPGGAVTTISDGRRDAAGSLMGLARTLSA
jgi:hypothetical protein